MKNTSAKRIALGGVLAAVALVIMCLGGLIPLATYICPMLCMFTCFLVLRFCGRRIAWAWYAVVCILGLLMGPDKEAAAVFLALGYYPVLKPKLERKRLPWLWKLLVFNVSTVLLYVALVRLLGLEALAQEFGQLGNWGLAILLLMGNATFFLADRVLCMLDRKLGVTKWKNNGFSTS